jgi:hypothetical protein
MKNGIRIDSADESADHRADEPDAERRADDSKLWWFSES